MGEQVTSSGEPVASIPRPAPKLPLPVVPVLDIKRGLVVQAIGGRRDSYAPIVTPLVSGSDPVAMAGALAERVGHRRLYLADLDSLEGAEPAWDIYRALLTAGCELWLDLGVTHARQAEALVRLLRQGRGGWRVIAALESLPDLNILSQILEVVGAERLLFSLDLRNGEVMTHRSAFQRPPLSIVEDVIRIGVKRMIVLDVGGVGRREGPTTLGICRQIRTRAPHVELVTGGGVRGIADLAEIRDAGCDAALVSTWLHTQEWDVGCPATDRRSLATEADLESSGGVGGRTRHAGR